MMLKISLERLLVESFKLQDHRQQSCVIRNVTVKSVRSSGHRVKTNVDMRGAERCIKHDKEKERERKNINKELRV